MYTYPHSVLRCTKRAWCCREFADCVNGEMVETITGDWMMMKLQRDGTCSYLDEVTERCTIYDHRPLMCARWDCQECNMD